jgi:hypothetical protein
MTRGSFSTAQGELQQALLNQPHATDILSFSRSGVLAEAADIRLMALVRLFLAQNAGLTILSLVPFEVWERASAYSSLNTFDVTRRLLAILRRRHVACPALTHSLLLDITFSVVTFTDDDHADDLLRAAVQEGDQLCFHCRKPHWDLVHFGLGGEEKTLLHVLLVRMR